MGLERSLGNLDAGMTRSWYLANLRVGDKYALERAGWRGSGSGGEINAAASAEGLGQLRTESGASAKNGASSRLLRGDSLPLPIRVAGGPAAVRGIR